MVSLLTAPAAAASMAQKPKPDLTLTAGALSEGSRHANFVLGQDSRVRFTWHHRTKNVGTAPARRRSWTAVQFLVGKDPFTPAGARLRVPPLDPGQAAAGRGAFTLNFNDGTWDYGTYPRRMCADATNVVNEPRTGNNCKTLHNLYVIPFDLKGSVGGTGELSPNVHPGVTLSWGGTVQFEAQEVSRSNDGIFDYTFAEGPLTYTVSGTDTLSGCAWSGTGTYTPDRPFGIDYMRLMFDRGHWYAAGISVDPAFHFTATLNCPNHVTFTWDVAPYNYGFSYWLDTGSARRFPYLGMTHLTGGWNEVTNGDQTIRYSWNLQASG
jgi:hypothetical protein